MSYGTYRVSASVTVVQVVFSYTVSIFWRSEAGSRSDAPTTRQPTPSPATLALVKMCEMLGGRGVCVSVLSPSCGELEGTGASPCAGERSTSWQIIRPKPSRKPRVPVSKVAHRKERMCCHWERAAVCERHVHTMAWHGLSRVHTTRCAFVHCRFDREAHQQECLVLLVHGWRLRRGVRPRRGASARAAQEIFSESLPKQVSK